MSRLNDDAFHLNKVVTEQALRMSMFSVPPIITFEATIDLAKLRNAFVTVGVPSDKAEATMRIFLDNVLSRNPSLMCINPENEDDKRYLGDMVTSTLPGKLIFSFQNTHEMWRNLVSHIASIPREIALPAA